MPAEKLEPAALCRRCDPAAFEFSTTADIADLPEFIGQARAVEAVNFGIGIQRTGYNLFALGPAGTGKQAFVRRHVEARAAHEAVPSDWCYVNNFADNRKPRALELPPGKATELSNDMIAPAPYLASLKAMNTTPAPKPSNRSSMNARSRHLNP